MNTTPTPRLDNTEWAAQQLGMDCARRGHAAPADPAAYDYHAIAMAVQTLPRGAPPADFSRQLMQCLAVPRAGIERRLLPGLLVALTAVAAGLVGVFGGYWWQLLSAAGSALPWALPVAACIAASRLCRRWLGARSNAAHARAT